VADTDVTYGNIIANPRGARSLKVTSSSSKNSNDAVLYSELQNADASTDGVAPSGDLYANVYANVS